MSEDDDFMAQTIAPQHGSPRWSDPSTTWSREHAEAQLRPYPSAPTSIATVSCRVPSLSWLDERYILHGLNPSVVPPTVDLTSPRVGRAITTHLSRNNPNLADMRSDIDRRRHMPQDLGGIAPLNLALFPANPSIPHVPPYPGVPPLQASQPNLASTSYVDGSRGCWDSRKYPQLYQHRRPWLPFHRRVINFTWDLELCEYMSAGDFFCWNDTLQPKHGGSWSARRLHKLFSKREKAEAEFETLRKEASKNAPSLPFSHKRQRMDQYDLPFFDPLKWSETLQWLTWLDGRGPLAYTLQYTAELDALNRWLRRSIDSAVGKLVPSPVSADLMGAWAVTIPTLEEWQFLDACGIPLYIITSIPSSHPLSSQLSQGNLDADERYRRNAFEAELGLQPCWIIDRTAAPNDIFPLIPDLRLQCLTDYLPTSILPPTVPAHHSNQALNSHLLSWVFPIYLDRGIQRFDVQTFTLHVSQFRDRYDLLLDYPAITSNIHLLNAEKDRHPLLDVIPPAPRGERKLRKFKEEYDEEGKFYWPKLLGRKSEAARDADYVWFYKNENIQIVSDEPLPGRDINFGRTDLYASSNGQISTSPRVYHGALNGGRIPGAYKFTWTHSPVSPTNIEAGTRTLGPAPPLVLNISVKYRPEERADKQSRRFISSQQLFLFDTSIPSVVHNYMLTHNGERPSNKPIPTFSDYVSQLSTLQRDATTGIDWEQIITSCEQAALRIQLRSEESGTTLISAEERRHMAGDMMRAAWKLDAQRKTLRDQLVRRVYKPAGGGNLVSPRPIPWRISGGSSKDICYPIRISGIHSGVTLEALFGMFVHIGFIKAVTDIVIYSQVVEADRTQSIDIGLRYCEDAIFMKAVLHGVAADWHLLEVQYLRGIIGQGKVISCKQSQRSLQDRFKRIVPFVIYPGLSSDLRQHAATLEGQLKALNEKERSLTHGEIDRIRALHRTPPVGIITEIESLCDTAHWNSSAIEITIAEKVGLNTWGDPDPVPANDVDLLYTTTMTHTMTWPTRPHQVSYTSKPGTAAPGQSGRQGPKGKHASKNSTKTFARRRPISEAYTAANGMHPDQVKNLMRAMQHNASRLRDIWRPSELQQLPTFSLQLEGGLTPIESIICCFCAFWDWQDSCMRVMRDYRDQEPPPPYDFAPFEDNFGGFARLESLRGPYYTAVSQALKLRAANGITESLPSFAKALAAQVLAPTASVPPALVAEAAEG